MKITKRAVIVAVLVVLCLGALLAACGSGAAGGSTGQIKHIEGGKFAISGYSNDYANTEVHLVLDGDDLGSVGRAETDGDNYVLLETNALDVSEKKQEGYQKLVIKAFGCEDITADEVSGRAKSETFYVQCPEDAIFGVTAFIGTDERTAPIQWDK